MERIERFPLGVVIIAVVMFFAAMGTASFWILRWTVNPSPNYYCPQIIIDK